MPPPYNPWSLIIPPHLVECFDILDVKEDDQTVCILLKEKLIPPDKHAESKGFYPECAIQDFPLRGRKVLLKITRRRWRDSTTGKEIKRPCDLVSDGAAYTKEFADFLKETDRI